MKPYLMSEECFHFHSDHPWFLNPEWLAQNLGLIKVRPGTRFEPKTFTAPEILAQSPAPGKAEPLRYSRILPSGNALVSVSGPMIKGESKFGGVNMLALGSTIDQLAEDKASARSFW